LFGLILDIKDFKAQSTAENRSKRGSSVLGRFSGKELSIAGLTAIQERAKADPSSMEPPGPRLLDEVYDVAVQRVDEEFFAKFQASPQYTSLVKEVAEHKKKLLTKKSVLKVRRVVVVEWW
jgi:predicted RNA-binding protein with PUA-like domain